MAQQDIPARLQSAIAASIKAANKAVADAVKGYRQLEKASLGVVKAQAQHIKSEAKMQAAMLKTQRDIARMARAYGHAAQSAAKAQQVTAHAAGGFSLGLKALIPTAAIVGGTKALSTYLTELARARDLARALAGGRDLSTVFGARRDYELFGKVAGEQFQARFLGADALKGMMHLRDELSRALGPETGTELATQVLGTFKGESRDQLRDFLTLASTDVSAALQTWMSPSNADAFATALAGVNQRMDDLSKTAFTIESAWIKIKDAFEKYVVSFVGANGEQLNEVIDHAANSIVNMINDVRQWGQDFREVFAWIEAGFKRLDATWDFWRDPFHGGARAHQAEQLTAEMQKYAALSQQAVARGDSAAAKEYSDKAQALYARTLAVLNGPTIDPLPPLKFAENVDKASTALDRLNRSKKDTDNNWQAQPPAVQAKGLLDDLDKVQKRLEGTLGVQEARLRRMESSLFGWSDAYYQRIAVYQAISAELENINQQVREYQALSHRSEDDEAKMIALMQKREDLLTRQNELLKEQGRGWLDAVKAEAYVTGRYSRIIINQDRGILRALRTGMAKPTPFLGVAGWSDVQPFRFSTSMSRNIAEYEKYAEKLNRHMGRPEMTRMLTQSIQSAQIAASDVMLRARSVTLQGVTLDRGDTASSITTSGLTTTATPATGGGSQKVRALQQLVATATTLLKLEIAENKDTGSRGFTDYTINARYPDVGPM